MPITIDGSGTITGASTLATTVASPTLTTPNINSAQFATVSGTAPIYPCRAWVNFNGTGTVAIRASGNVTSITDNGTGDYTVNFTTALPDANYAVNISGLSASASDGRAAYFVKGVRGTGVPSTQTTSAVGVQSIDAGTGSWPVIDAGYVCVSIFR